jgi:putative flippase GtrA
MLLETVGAVAQRAGVRQFAKFCLIGASSTVIDVGLLNVFTQVFRWHWIPSQVLSFSLAVTNGFVWNSLWTFRGVGAGSKRARYAKFYATNVAGLLLNLAVMKLVMLAMTGRMIYHGNPPPPVLYTAKAVAIVVVSLWNFGASKYWTFRPTRAKEAHGRDDQE